MKAPAAFFLCLFALLPAAAACAEDRLIPIDDFSIVVPVNDPPPEPFSKKGLRVSVWVSRHAHEPAGDTKVSVSCPGISMPDHTLEAEEVAVLQKACSAALQGKEFREETGTSKCMAVYEVVTVDGQKLVRLQRGSTGLLAPEEGARLKESLAQAAVAEAWYKKLLTGHTLPAKTAAAHPPMAADYFLYSSLGKVRGGGLDYEVSVMNRRLEKKQPYQVTHSLHLTLPGGNKGHISDGSDWLKGMRDELARALKAVAKEQDFATTSAWNRSKDSFTVTANLITQKADVSFEPGLLYGKQPPVQGNFSAAQLATIEKLVAGGEAREKWFAEHEAWFFERP